MATEITALIQVTDLQVSTDYLVKTLGFKLDCVAGDGSTVTLKYRGALLKLKSKTGDEPPDMPENLLEIQMRVENIEEIYKRALSGGAIIRRYLECAESKDGSADRQFTVSLPEGWPLTFVSASPTGVTECGGHR